MFSSRRHSPTGRGTKAARSRHPPVVKRHVAKLNVEAGRTSRPAFAIGVSPFPRLRHFGAGSQIPFSGNLYAINESPEGTDREDVVKDKHRWSYRGCACCDGSTLSLSGAMLNRRNFLGVPRRWPRSVLADRATRRRKRAEAVKPYRIDVHHHLSPLTYIVASNTNNFGDALMKNWTSEKTLQDMDNAGIAVAMLSVTTPALNFTSGGACAQACARVQRLCSQAKSRPSRPLRKLCNDSAHGRRGKPARDRLCARHAQGRRDRPHDELR